MLSFEQPAEPLESDDNLSSRSRGVEGRQQGGRKEHSTGDCGRRDDGRPSGVGGT